MALALRYAEEIASCAPRAVQATKAVAIAAVEPVATIAELERLSAAKLKELYASEDAAEGRSAFLQKRAPRWRNR